MRHVSWIRRNDSIELRVGRGVTVTPPGHTPRHDHDDHAPDHRPPSVGAARPARPVPVSVLVWHALVAPWSRRPRPRRRRCASPSPSPRSPSPSPGGWSSGRCPSSCSSAPWWARRSSASRPTAAEPGPSAVRRPPAARMFGRRRRGGRGGHADAGAVGVAGLPGRVGMQQLRDAPRRRRQSGRHRRGVRRGHHVLRHGRHLRQREVRGDPGPGARGPPLRGDPRHQGGHGHGRRAVPQGRQPLVPPAPWSRACDGCARTTSISTSSTSPTRSPPSRRPSGCSTTSSTKARSATSASSNFMGWQIADAYWTARQFHLEPLRPSAQNLCSPAEADHRARGPARGPAFRPRLSALLPVRLGACSRASTPGAKRSPRARASPP